MALQETALQETERQYWIVDDESKVLGCSTGMCKIRMLVGGEKKDAVQLPSVHVSQC